MSNWMRLVDQVSEHRDQLQQRLTELQLGIFAEEGIHQFMGKRVQITVSWPDGPPAGFADAEAVRDWCRERLAEHRTRAK